MGLTAEDFLDTENIVQLGYPPNRIDLITDLTGVKFEECYQNRKEVNFEGVDISFISVDDLITNKKQSGRLQDLADAEKLEKGKKKTT